ncbi:helix-turn-helix domain-containing protein [Halomarina pelagica]|uniref:helix-turn-helix domain-containing protein n=1 Tax=Halomarina pelagica TaxID=2961599 RepID=UPI0020C1E300|nr:helix-turn-helix domain-containing protein [Halomarina sp. BND7]
MSSGLRVEVAVSAPGDCPVASVSAETNAPVASVSRSSITDATGRIAEEFTLDGDASPSRDDLTEVAAYSGRTVYRFRRGHDRGCVCENVEAFGYPVAAIRARAGTLYVSFHAPDVETVRAIVTALRERFSGIRLRKLVRPDERSGDDLVFVDRSRLTDRQREVLQTAYDAGYFEHPKGANASEVAALLDISPSTFAEHLAAAQRKVLDALLTA